MSRSAILWAPAHGVICSREFRAQFWPSGAQQLHRVLIHGSSFSLPLRDGGAPIVGFFTTRFVAATNVRDAEIKARSSVLREWKRRGYEASAGSSPILELEDVEIIHSRFRFRSGDGFTFFGASAGD
jgi:hypothetical protein